MAKGSHPIKARSFFNAAVALGGNIGCVPNTFLKALDLLHDSVTQVTATSCLYQSEPLHLPTPSGVLKHERRAAAAPASGQPPILPCYFNAACTLRTQLGPRQLLVRLQAIERQLGRERGTPWGPRTLDLDLLVYNDRQINDGVLILPHGGIPYRAFVLKPLHDLRLMRPWPRLTITVNDLLIGQNDRACGILHKQLSWMTK